jgi:hypothetical protein
MNLAEMMLTIQQEVGGAPPYANWTIGLTNYPSETRMYIRENGPGYPEAYWRDWPVASLNDAIRTIATLTSLGMRRFANGEGQIDESKPIYLFIY